MPEYDVRIEEHIYASREKTKLPLTLYRPANDLLPLGFTKRPAVLMVHGGAWIAGTRLQMRWYGKELARMGFVAAAPVYRKLPRYHVLHALHDVKTALCWLRQNAAHLACDPDTIILMGNSAGGHLVLLAAATANREEFQTPEHCPHDTSARAVVALYPAADLRLYRRGPQPISTAGVAEHFVHRLTKKAAPAGVDSLEWFTPLTHFSTAMPPTLIIHGTRDVLAPIEGSEQSYKRLMELGVNAELCAVPGAFHAFDQIMPWHKPWVFERIYQFLRRHLGAQENGANATASCVSLT